MHTARALVAANPQRVPCYEAVQEKDAQTCPHNRTASQELINQRPGVRVTAHA